MRLGLGFSPSLTQIPPSTAPTAPVNCSLGAPPLLPPLPRRWCSPSPTALWCRGGAADGVRDGAGEAPPHHRPRRRPRQRQQPRPGPCFMAEEPPLPHPRCFRQTAWERQSPTASLEGASQPAHPPLARGHPTLPSGISSTAFRSQPVRPISRPPGDQILARDPYERPWRRGVPLHRRPPLPRRPTA